ncbi:MAG TPA: hypothetical protein DCZ07_07805 [Alphaproteobacteria bacterium]|nr:hypothetical protein [Alphaproteobacteria bacterium]
MSTRDLLPFKIGSNFRSSLGRFWYFRAIALEDSLFRYLVSIAFEVTKRPLRFPNLKILRPSVLGDVTENILESLPLLLKQDIFQQYCFDCVSQFGRSESVTKMISHFYQHLNRSARL